MANPVRSPAVHTLLPPLLACLPTAFASTRPPPALLPLLSPILRQRVQLLSDSASSPSDSWLSKLAWDPTKAERLAFVVGGEAFELHPVSNEIEFDDVRIVGYRRLDEETLHSRVDIRDLGLTVVYLWCVGDEAGGGDGWRIAEVLPLDDDEVSLTSWTQSIEEADEASKHSNTSSAGTRSKDLGLTPAISNGVPTIANANDPDNMIDGDNDDDYWAQYDNPPTSTLGPQPSPGPPPPAITKHHGRTKSETEYFSRYSAVQPDMDNDDPSTDRNAIGESSLNGGTLTSPTTIHTSAQSLPASTINKTLVPYNEIPAPQPSHPAATTEQPRPQTPSSPDSGLGSGSAVVEKLEGSAMLQSQTELAVRQHVASMMKSLWRLARSTGMEMGEFERVVGREVELLGVEEGMEDG
ncbi:MAG: hypothetical protein Q9201_005503 [Fulgogasparrea decipioides]